MNEIHTTHVIQCHTCICICCISDVPGKVKTLAELEAGLRSAESNRPHHPGNKPGPRLSTPPGHRQTPPMQGRSADDSGDLTAFNKLISLMKAGAATPVESPKVR